MFEVVAFHLNNAPIVKMLKFKFPSTSLGLIVLGFNDSQPLWVLLCCLPEKGKKEIEELLEETKERNREERGTGMKVKKQRK